MMHLRTLSINLFLILCAAAAAAQDKPSALISGEFRHLNLDSFARRIEAIVPCHFYYDPSQADSLSIDLTVKDKSLPEVLELAFRDSHYHYATDADGNIFISRDWLVQTSLPSDYFHSIRDTASRVRRETAKEIVPDFSRTRKGAGGVLDENKLHEIGTRTNTVRPGNSLVHGYVKNLRTGDVVAGAIVTVDKPAASAVTDRYGYYSISLPRGYHILSIQGIGMRDTRFPVMLYADGRLDIELKEQVVTLREVIVSAEKTVNVNRVQMGVERLDIKTIKQVPTVMGEADILRVVMTLPGVKTVGEASTGLNVRGGSSDQNLILFNDMTVYNPSHFFGMFSAFNPDVVKDVELYKSSIPAKYGGRASSVLDISGREGNKKEYAGIAGIGPVTSRIMLEGPLDKNKTSFILGGRMTYANWLLSLLPDEYKHSRGAFNDLDLTISHELNKKNTLYLSGYLSNDRFNLNSDTTYKYGNRNASLKWKHVFSSSLSGVLAAGYDRYQYSVSSTGNPVNGFRLGFDINQVTGKADFSWLVHPKHTLEFGLSTLRYTLHPGSYQPDGGQSLVTPQVIQTEQALESAAYLSDRWSVNNQLSISGGIRLSVYNYLGPHTENIYAPGLPVDTANLTGTKNYSSGQVIKTWMGPEYRFSLRYAFTNDFSVKAGYNSLRQYTHMLSNTTAMSPTDIWKLSDPNIRPQLGEQVSVGFYKNLRSNTIELSMELYYKRLHNYLDYRSGATLIMNPHIETDVLNTRGKAYGVELMVKKQAGKLNGWISYTWARTLLQTDDPRAGETVNGGRYYPADFDIPNDVTAVGNFRVNHRFSFSMNLLYYTGRPITLPIGEFNLAGSERVLYSDRNAYRIPDYFRADFSMNIDGNFKVHQWTHNSWTIGVYNLTGRKNPYSVYFVSQSGVVNGYKLSIFGSAIPFVNYNIRF